jgi:hypothetical protein
MPRFLNKIGLPVLPSAPSSPSKGDMYYNSTEDSVFVYDGLNWIDLGAGGSGSGDITAVIAGTDITGGATSGAATVNVAPSVKAVTWWMGS